jgi:hypothetical protein
VQGSADNKAVCLGVVSACGVTGLGAIMPRIGTGTDREGVNGTVAKAPEIRWSRVPFAG